MKHLMVQTCVIFDNFLGTCSTFTKWPKIYLFGSHVAIIVVAFAVNLSFEIGNSKQFFSILLHNEYLK
jgi:hypothetical protein